MHICCDILWMMEPALYHGYIHDDVIKWKHFPRYWPFVRGIHRSPVNSPHKGQWRGALMFSLICVWINGWVNNREAGDLRHYRGHYDVIVMVSLNSLVPGRCSNNFKSLIFKLVSRIDILTISCKIAVGWVPQDLIGYLNHRWHHFILPYGVIRSQCVQRNGCVQWFDCIWYSPIRFC